MIQRWIWLLQVEHTHENKDLSLGPSLNSIKLLVFYLKKKYL